MDKQSPTRKPKTRLSPRASRLHSHLAHSLLGLLGMSIVGMSGCAGLNSIPQSLGINASSRVPPPATGSFAVPNSYTNGVGGPSAPAALPTNTTTGMQNPAYNPAAQPASQVLSSINRFQNKIQDTTTQVRDSVNRATTDFNTRVETAGASVNRIGEGVVQAGAVLTESIQDASQVGLPAGPITQDTNASWRNPTTAR
jgi:hypothetical protein